MSAERFQHSELVEKVRAQHLADHSAAGKPRPDNCEICAALLGIEEQYESLRAAVRSYMVATDDFEPGHPERVYRWRRLHEFVYDVSFPASTPDASKESTDA